MYALDGLLEARSVDLADRPLSKPAWLTHSAVYWEDWTAAGLLLGYQSSNSAGRYMSKCKYQQNHDFEKHLRRLCQFWRGFYSVKGIPPFSSLPSTAIQPNTTRGPIGRLKNMLDQIGRPSHSSSFQHFGLIPVHSAWPLQSPPGRLLMHFC